VAFDNYLQFAVLRDSTKKISLSQDVNFRFVWSKDWNKLHVCERIKRSVLKQNIGKAV
jgi:hypothetical protein